MKIRFIYLLLFSLAIFYTQSNFASTLNDSLLSSTDSLAMEREKIDSLEIQPFVDSLENSSDNEDSSDYLNIFAKVEEYKTSSRNNFIPDKNKQLYWSIQNHYFGLSSDNYFIRKDNFAVLNSLYPTFLSLQQTNRFYTENFQGSFVNLDKEYYTLPVTAIEVVASTGDYDLATGYVAMKKNRFLNKYNLDFRMNFVKGDFYYGNELASNTSTNLIIPIKDSKLDIAFNSISFEAPYHRLSPAFRLNNNIFEENANSFSALYHNNLLDLGLKYSHEKYQRLVPQTLERDYWQLLAHKKFISKYWLANINYEYFLHTEDFFSQELNSLSSDIDHLLDLSLASDYKQFNLTNRTIITHPYQLLTNTNISYNISDNWQIGTFSNFRETLKKHILLVDYATEDDNNPLNNPYYLNEKNDTGINLNLSSANINLAMSISKTIIDTDLINSPFKKDYQTFKYQLQGNIFYKHGLFAFKLASLMKFYQEEDNYDIHHLPKALLSNSLEISRDLNYDNFIKAGIAHHYFDTYLAWQNSDEVLYPQASLLDVYAGLQITKLFEINLYWKNILDEQVITGHQTIPQSITVLISWNFLN